MIVVPDDPVRGASGFICPRCGGALWEHPNRGESRFECRIGDTFSALELWIEHCARRNRALIVAARELAENAALAQHLASWARGRGNAQMAGRLDQEAAFEEAALRQVRAMLDGLDGDDADTRA